MADWRFGQSDLASRMMISNLDTCFYQKISDQAAALYDADFRAFVVWALISQKRALMRKAAHSVEVSRRRYLVPDGVLHKAHPSTRK